MNKSENAKMKYVGRKGDKEIYAIGGVGFVNSKQESANAEYSENSSEIFDGDDGTQTYKNIHQGNRSYTYVPFGMDDQLPFHIIGKVGENMVMAQNKLFNVLTCYGQGIRFFDRKTLQKTDDEEIQTFAFRNQLNRFFVEQAMDMKYFYFTVTCIILDNEGLRIVQMRHKESCYVRFEKADKLGHIGHVFYANWRNFVNDDDIEVIPLLDETDPYGDLQVRLGLVPDPKTGRVRKPAASDPFGRATRNRKFAILTRFPTPGFQYYPIPFYSAIFRDSWYDIYELIGKGKRAKIRNSAPPRFQVEVHKDYWDNLCDQEGITDPEKRQARIKLEKHNIEAFISGNVNIGKTWVTGYYVDPASGKDVRMVRIYDIEQGKKEGGDWSDDVQEASNSLCYGDNVHPNLVGATPGKSSMNNSGSDKRELFLLKQATETAFHDVLLEPFRVLIYFNGWNKKVDVDVPMIILTTLDENKETKTVKPDPNGNNGTEN
ncbi:MAG: hypothetical protein LKE54_04440 [Prevotella sp.]|jgi:hypothetical protein|nr:hypothetical protein [Prevotella sp.]MCH3994291.1 hypothetical protein [Prevotella sp.]